MSERVTICREGCKPVWAGSLERCPECGSRSVRTAEVRLPDVTADEIMDSLESEPGTGKAEQGLEIAKAAHDADRWGAFHCPDCGAPCHVEWDECGSCDRDITAFKED